jgi:type VI secretion system secreted protein VgrG
MTQSTPHSPAGPGGAPDRFRLELAAHPGPLQVARFTGREAISKPYSFEVLVTAEASSGLLDPEILGSAARFSFFDPEGRSRVVNGVVAAVEPSGELTTGGKLAVVVRVVPRLWLLKHRKQSRIFQDRTVPEIIQIVLATSLVPCAVRLLRPHPPRIYCVQHEESDFAFVRRLAAEEGLFYYFEASDGVDPGEVLAGAAMAGASALAIRCRRRGRPPPPRWARWGSVIGWCSPMRPSSIRRSPTAAAATPRPRSA